MMMTKKPVRRAERVEVVYDKKHWSLLKELRFEAVEIMEILDQFHLRSIAHGSIARGDVSDKSDIDLFLPDPPSSFIIENTLQNTGVSVNRRIVVQATPLYKRLMLIEPTLEGHVESTIIGQEEAVAGLLGISVSTVLDRVRTLLRRDKTGRTGVFIERELLPNETFEMALKKLVAQNPAVRRRFKLYGK
jgi:predicted nucleotidyltransferase